MIASQTQPRFNSFEGECHDGLATLVCRCDGSHVAELRLSFGNAAELERFALAVQTLVEQYRVELANPPPPTVDDALDALLRANTNPPMSEVDRLLVEAVVSSRHPQTDRPQWGKCPVCTGDFGPVGNTEPCDLCRAEAANPPPVGLEEAVFGDPPPICTCNPAPELIGDRAYHQDACPMSPKMVPF